MLKTMKKFIITILATLLAGMVAVQAVELTGTVTIAGNPVAATYVKLTDTTVALGNGHNACVPHYVEGFLTVPGTVTINGTTYTVTEIADLAFRLCDKLTGVEIEEGVTRVGSFAFIGCPAISEITLPSSMRRLGSGAFQSCLGSLHSVTCLGSTPPVWEYNDVFVFHSKGIGDNAAGVISAATKLFVPDEDIYRAANYTSPSLGWTTPDGWGSFSYVYLGQATFHISSDKDLQILHEIVNVGHMYGQIGAVYLDADIDMSAYPWDRGMGVSEEEAFEAEFYGNGHTISNLTIDTEGYGGFFAHYGGKEIRDVTFKNCTFSCANANRFAYPNGVLGGVVGECGATTLNNVCLDNCEFTSDFDANGLMMGRCLTSGGANFSNCVIKGCHFKFNRSPSYNGNLVGECSGGHATDCAIFDTENRTMAGWTPRPFVGKCQPLEEFYVLRCYNTQQIYGNNPETHLAYSCQEYQPEENVKYDHVVLDDDRIVEYIDADGQRQTKSYTVFYSYPSKSAYFRSLFMVAELGLENWVYQEGAFPVPATMEHLLPEPQVNRASYRPLSMTTMRVNGLSPAEHIPSSAWYDMTDATGYRSYDYYAQRLWIDNDFSTQNPLTTPHNPMLPIGAAKISSANGIRYDRILQVTPNGMAGYTVPNVKLDSQGNPMVDSDGFYILDGETTLYEYEVYTATDYTLYLPYELHVNGGAVLYQPHGVRHEEGVVRMEMDIVKDGIIRPWQPYYIMVNDAPIKLGVEHEIVLERRIGTGVAYQSFDDDNYRMYGTMSRFTPDSGHQVYQLQEDDTWRIDNTTIQPFMCYVVNNSNTDVDHFTTVIDLPLSDNGENADLIAAYDGRTVDVVLDGRTFYKDDTWYTLCLPFDLEDLRGTPLYDARIRRLYNSQYDSTSGTLKIKFILSSTIEAGKPYLVKWDQAPRVDNPIFENVTIRNAQERIDKLGSVSFVGTFSPVLLPEGNDYLLYMGDDNQLFYPESSTEVNAFRGFFMLNGAAAARPAGMRRLILDFDAEPTITGLDDIKDDQNADNNWYTIDGRVLRDHPTAPGIYIHNGKKTLIK